MNLKAFVQTLSLQEREELLNILTEDIAMWTTIPPHIQEEMEGNATASENSEELLEKNSQDFTMHSDISNDNKKGPVKARKNAWTDSGEDRHIETPSAKRTPRTRRPPQQKDVVCSACGKKQTVNASLVFGEYYRCESCIR